MDVSMAGGNVTDTQRRATVASLVTAGALLLAAGCASQGPVPSTAPRSTTPRSAMPRSSAATTAELRAMAARYMAIAQPANRELDHEFDGFGDHVKDGGLAAAQADLRAAAATERRFDRQLIAISFPPRTEPFVRLLYRVNQARAELTSTAAAATSLRELRGYQRRLDAANEPVEDAVRVIRGQLDLPPPDTS
jgi:DNA-binding GntR family transcriptional regulator